MLGTYAGVKFSTETNKNFHEYTQSYKIPNRLRPDKLHATILYSRKFLPDFKPLGTLESFWYGSPTSWQIWQTRLHPEQPTTNCLVLLFECVELHARHIHLMEEHEAQHDFSSYNPHVTLSYDVGELDVSKIPLPNFWIEMIEEYAEDLKFDYATNKGGNR